MFVCFILHVTYFVYLKSNCCLEETETLVTIQEQNRQGEKDYDALVAENSTLGLIKKAIQVEFKKRKNTIFFC